MVSLQPSRGRGLQAALDHQLDDIVPGLAPFFQLGEHKYGKPILDRIITPDTSIDLALKTVCISMASTLMSNLSVGMPLDLAVIRKDALAFATRRRIERDDPGFAAVSQAWSVAVRKGVEGLPSLI